MRGALQPLLDGAVTRGDVPFAVAMVADAGGVLWQGGAGEAAPGLAAGPDTVFAVFSMTKAVGAVAAMILTDRGRLDLDAPVARFLPEFATLRRLDGWDGDVPRLVAPARPVTLRQLAAHTAGLPYGFWSAEMRRYTRATGLPLVTTGMRRGLDQPLLCEPGEQWLYGIGLDWLGLVIEAVDGRRVDRFVHEEILGPLGMTSTGFELDAGLEARRARSHRRTSAGGLEPFELAPPSRPEVYGMGHALWSTPSDYVRFLRMLIGGGALDGTRILSAAAMAELLANQIGDLRIGRLVTAQPAATADLDLFPGIPKTHSLAALRVEADVPGMRRAGSQGWAGLLNTHYWIDPSSGIAAVLMTQMLPFVDPRFTRVYEAFERGVYAACSDRSRSK